MSKEPTELEVITPQMSDLSISRPPEIVLQEAQKAASALKDVISKKARPVIMNGEQYLEFEDWQTVGHFYGLKVKTGEAIPVEINGVHGAKAQAVVIDLHSGREVGGAEAYCLRDERNWESKPWFQLASMAQTRAGAKSLRNVLAWVVVLAGYRATPSEELDGMIVKRQEDAADTVRPTVATTQQDSDAPAPSSAKAFCEEQATKAGSGEHTAEGYIGTYQPRLSGKTSPPGRFTLDTLHGEITLQFWEKPDGMGTPNHSYARVTYRVSQRGKFTNNELLKLEWAAPPQ